MDRELERILRDLTDELGDLVKVLGSTNKKVIENSKNTKQEIENRKRTIRSMSDFIKKKKESGSAVDAFGIEVKEATAELGTFEKKLEAMPSPMGLLKKGFLMAKDAVLALGGALLKTALEFGKTSADIRSLGDAVDKGIADLGFLGKGAKFVADELDDNIQMFKGLAQSGATFNSSIMQMRDAAFRAGMPLVQFQELIQNNSTTLARLFGSVNQGIPAIVDLGRNLRAFTKDELSGFGLTLDDTNEFLTTQAEILRAQGRSERVTAAFLLENTKAYAKQLTILSRLTGESVKELDAQRRARAADGVLQAKLAQMSVEDQRKFQAALELFPKGAQQAVMELGLLDAPISDAARSLQLLSDGRVEEIIKGLMAPGELTNEAMAEFSNQIKTLGTDIQGSAIADSFATAALAGGDAFFREGLDLITAMAGSAANIEEITKATRDAEDGVTNELVKTQDTLQQNTVALQNLGTAILGGLILEDEALGAKVLESFNRDAGQTSEEVVNKMKTLFGLDTPGSTTKKSTTQTLDIGDTSIGGGVSARSGTDGFHDFGTGTPAMLHGVEAVVPKNDFGQALKVLGEMVGTNTTSTTSATTTMTAPNQENQVFTQLADSNERIANHLNTLITIGSMTEKNTKDTKIAIANSTGSLV